MVIDFERTKMYDVPSQNRAKFSFSHHYTIEHCMSG